MPIFCATYDYTDDTGQRDRIRPAHREWLRSQPSLLISGPTDANGAVLIFHGDSAKDVEALLDHDPFAIAGLIAVRRVVGWTPASGPWREQVEIPDER